jgi:hypothetical protein
MDHYFAFNMWHYNVFAGEYTVMVITMVNKLVSFF